ncbi:hypothetical protein P3TCK_25630 [Photobacterium profundum 3TCK]|uniref:Uncharacterized protein n=1 Tax=Photobacterium profundum 3TCK TaxID=314280 RepID=Q1YYR9_9GAMM|nr:hypothetical protein P3TCK_25630 [Photobacterium profundum 3TCK]
MAENLLIFSLIADSKKAHIFRYEPSLIWQGWRDSNSQHADLESAALPVGATPL